MGWKSSARSWANWLGFDVRRYHPLGFNAFEAQKILMPWCTSVFDVGAYRGDVAEKYLELFPRASVFCFEPFAESFGRLSQRLGSNRRVTLVNNAMAATTGTAVLNLTSEPHSNSLLTLPEESERVCDLTSAGQRAVETVSLDDFHLRPNILKLDVQGAELGVLQGGRRLLESGSTKLIFTEVNFVRQYTGAALYHEVAMYLQGYDYKLFGIYNHRFTPGGQLWYGDAIFYHRSLRLPPAHSMSYGESESRSKGAVAMGFSLA